MIQFSKQVEDVLKELEILRDEGSFPNIDRETAEYLYNLVLERKPTNLVEIGACNGYSTIWLALAAKEYGGHLITHEWGADRCSELKANLKRLKELDNIEVRYGNAKDTIDTIKDIEFAFIDATKSMYLELFKLMEPNFNKNTIIAADNIVSHKHKLNDYIEYVTNSEKYSSELIEIGSGLLITTIN